MKLSIEAMLPRDWPQVRAIYLEGIATGNATFAQTAPEWETWDTEHLAAGRLVARVEQEIAGWTALSRVSGRCVYAGVADAAWAGNCWGGWWLNRKRRESGPCRRGSSPRTRRASRCTSAPDFGWSAGASAWAR